MPRSTGGLAHGRTHTTFHEGPGYPPRVKDQQRSSVRSSAVRPHAQGLPSGVSPGSGLTQRRQCSSGAYPAAPHARCAVSLRRSTMASARRPPRRANRSSAAAGSAEATPCLRWSGCTARRYRWQRQPSNPGCSHTPGALPVPTAGLCGEPYRPDATGLTGLCGAGMVFEGLWEKVFSRVSPQQRCCGPAHAAAWQGAWVNVLRLVACSGGVRVVAVQSRVVQHLPGAALDDTVLRQAVAALDPLELLQHG